MARYKKPGTKKKAGPPPTGPIGCVLLIVLVLAFTFWALSALLNTAE